MQDALKSLQQELTANLSRAERYRRIIRVVKTPVFAAVALWMLFVISLPFASPYLVKNGIIAFDSNFQNLIIGYFAGTAIGIMVLTFAFSNIHKAFSRIESDTISRIVRQLFPTAKMHSNPQAVPDSVLKNSQFFERSGDGGYIPAIVFSSLELPSEQRTLHVADMGITHNNAGMSSMLGMYKELFLQIFRSRVEMAAYLFRGVFAWSELEKRIPGSILILPDHLEDKLGYLAKHVQSLSNRRNLKLVTLEDPEFERLFTVYATDEVLARYVLTPAMMLDITELRQKYSRDIMISFNANRFSIAVAMKDGFLNLRGKAIKNGNIVEEIYNDILTTQSILTQIKLDKIA